MQHSTMPRIPNIRPTLIYWLVDVRPQTLAIWSNGQPFYCGKTVRSVALRLQGHRYQALRKPNRDLSRKLTECGECIRVEIIETVPSGADWASRERFWIKTLRVLYPLCLNITDGGHGAAGMVLSEEHRSKIGLANKGRIVSTELRAKRRALQIGKTISAETRAKIGASLKGTPFSPERCARISAAKKGKKHSAETRAKLSAIFKGKQGKKHSDETRAKLSAMKKGRPGKSHSPETRAKMSATHLARSRIA